MTVTATAPIGTAMSKLVTHISNSSTLQAACGVSTAALALRYIYWPWGDFNEMPRPFVIVTPEGYENTRLAGGASTVLMPVGNLRVLVGIDHDNAYSESDNWILVDNIVGGIIQDLRDISGISDNLNMTNISQAMPHAVSDPTTVATGGAAEANPKFWLSGFEVQWGAL